MKPVILTNEEAARFGFTHGVRVYYTDLSGTAALTKTIEVHNVPAKGVVRKAAAIVETAFAGTTTLALEVGDGGDVDRALVSFDMKSAAGSGKVAIPSTMPNFYSAADTLDLKFTATVENLTSLSAGQVLVLWDVTELGDVMGQETA
jgi:hypothetical protein